MGARSHLRPSRRGRDGPHPAAPHQRAAWLLEVDGDEHGTYTVWEWDEVYYAGTETKLSDEDGDTFCDEITAAIREVFR